MHIIGVDIGGTFTDFVLLRDGKLTIHKQLSTPANPAHAMLDGIVQLGAPPTVVHGTTVATNALLERRGAATALITTAGFADVLVLGRGNRAHLYDLRPARPTPLVPAAWRREVPERLNADGSVLQPLDHDALHALVADLAASPIEAVAVCLLHSYANPAHEQQVAAALRAMHRPNHRPPPFVCVSSEVLPEYREYERTSTTVVNAYVAPILDRYLSQLERALTNQGVQTLRIMASDGGSMRAGSARDLAARTTLSGPAGGVVGAAAVAEQAGYPHIITFDMGGTSTDVALCPGTLPQTASSDVGGLPVRLPAIDIHTVGAGGGSLARIDAGGALRVGPQSAGADPGPACYGTGTQPTVTDANVVLGRLQAQGFLGGDMPLDTARAATAIAEVAAAAHLAPHAAALGIVRVANAAMERAIRTISVARGHDPRDFVLVAFGGAGPLHAAYLAAALGMQRVLVPRYPGVLSALGMLTASITRDYVVSLQRPLDTLTNTDLAPHLADLLRRGQRDLRPDQRDVTTATAHFSLDMRYMGQAHEITTPLHTQPADSALPPAAATLLPAAAAQFHALHQQQTGHHLAAHPVEVVTLRLKIVGSTPARASLLQPMPPPPATPAPPPHATIQAYLASDHDEPHATALYQRESLPPGCTITGAAIVLQRDTTTVIPPGWHARVDGYHNLLLTHT